MRTFSSKRSVMSIVLILTVLLSTIGLLSPRVNADGNIPAPTGLEWQGNYAVWAPVDGVNDYTVRLYKDGNSNIIHTQTVVASSESDCYYDFSERLDYNGNGHYMFSVTAGNGTESSEAAFSDYQFYVIGTNIAVFNLSATIDVPAAGQTPFATVTSGDPSKYDTEVALCLDELAWFKGGTISAPGVQMTASDTFEAGETYIVEVEFTQKPGYIFDSWEIKPTLNGNTGEYCGYNPYKGSVYYRYALTVSSTPTYKVTFSNGWGNAEYASSYVEEGGKVSAPEDPTYDRATEFLGWYTDLNFTTKFDFDTPITENITLYPKWKSNIAVEITTYDKDGNFVESKVVTGSGASGIGGSGSVSKSEAAAGDKVKISGATPADGYELVSVNWGDGAQGGTDINIGDEITMPNYGINVEFIYKEIDDRTEYPVIINLWSLDEDGNTIYPRGTGGTVTIDKDTLKIGQTINITVTPDSGFTVTSIGIGDGAQGFGQVYDTATAQFTVPDYWYSSIGVMQIDVMLQADSSIKTSKIVWNGAEYCSQTYSAINGTYIPLMDYPEFWSIPEGMHFEGWEYDGGYGLTYGPVGDTVKVNGPMTFTAIIANRITGWTDTGAGGVVESSMGDAIRGLPKDGYLDRRPGYEVVIEFQLEDGYYIADNKLEIIGSDGVTVLEEVALTNISGNWYHGTFTMPNEDISWRLTTRKVITQTLTPGWNEIDGEYYYADQNGNLVYSCWIKEGNKTYYIGPAGTKVTGRQIIDGDFYYFKTDGRMVTGWKTLGSSTYYFDPATGKAVTGWQTIDGAKYYFKSNWKMATGWKVTSSGTSYYLDPVTGKAAIGLTEIEGNTYYFSSAGKMQTGFVSIDNYTYYFDGNGVMQTGRVTIDGGLYYFKTNGRMVTGFKTLGNYTYYFDPATGKAITGWQTIDGYRYYFKSNGKMYTGWKTTSGGATYYFDPDTGRAVTGYQTIDGVDYYFNSNGKLVT